MSSGLRAFGSSLSAQQLDPRYRPRPLTLGRARLYRTVLQRLDPSDAASEIAERGSMKLHQTDVLLHRARLFGDREALAESRALIEKHGYGRRLGELEDAEGWLGM